MSIKLNAFVAFAMAGALTACGTKTPDEIAADPNAVEVTVPVDNIRTKNEIDASQMISSNVRAVEFTSVTDPSKQCMVTILDGNGYTDTASAPTCWDKKPVASPAP